MIKPSCHFEGTATAEGSNVDPSDSWWLPMIDHSTGINISCISENCRVRAWICSSDFDPTIEGPSSSHCPIQYAGDGNDSGIVLKPVYVQDHYSDLAEHTGRLLVCQELGEYDGNITVAKGQNW